MVQGHVVGIDRESAPVRHGIPRVHREIHNELFELTRIDLDQPARIDRRDLQSDLLAEEWLEQSLYCLDLLVRVDSAGLDDLPARDAGKRGQQNH